MTDVCRLCLSKQYVNHLIFDENNIIFKIEACLPIKISQTDNLPKKICNGCSLKINDIYDYCERAVNAEKQLLKSSKKLETVLQCLPKKEFSDLSPRIKEEPNEFGNSINTRSKGESVIVLNSSSTKLSLQHVSVNFSSKYTQTDLSLLDSSPTVEIAHIQLEDDKFDDEIKIKEEDPEPVEEEHYDDEEDHHLDADHIDQYSSDDNLTLNKIITAPPLKIKIKNELSDGFVYKKKKAKKKKKEFSEHDESPAEKRPRGRPKGSGNKIHKKEKKKSRNILDEGLVELEGIKVEYKGMKVETDERGDKWFYPEGTAEEAKKWQCLTCFVFKNSRTELLQHYKDHVENPSSITPVAEDEIKTDESADIKPELQDLKKTEIPSVKTNGEDFIILNPLIKKERSYQCMKCPKIFDNKRAVMRHLISHDATRPFPCNICGRSYKRAYEILLHGRAHNGVKTLFCRYEQCSYSTVYRGALMSHHKRHEPNFKYTCEVCNKGFDVLTWFKEHQNVHTGDKPFTCDLCGKSFVYSRYLTSHRKSVHPDASDTKLLCKHRCPTCPRQFPHRKLLRAHAAREHGARPENGNGVLCDICGKGLSSREHLKFHRRTHTGEKPHVCRTCGKGFVKKCNLTLHERVHSGERPHVCSHCGKAFSQRSTLVIHERYHSGARPYQCQNCNKGFVARGLLSMHLKTCV